MNTPSHPKAPAPSRQLPMEVTQIHRLPSGITFPICPGCRRTLDREYQRYCDRCGQHLRWRSFRKAEVVSWPEPL